MPLVNRKPVEIPPLSDQVKALDRTTLVWMIEATGEIFATYDDYAHRMAYYGQPLFQCETTLKTGLTFLEAVQSEREESERMENTISRPLMMDVLRRAHWSTLSRIDLIADDFIEHYKSNYLQGETVNIEVGNTKRPAEMIEPFSFVRFEPPRALESVEINGAINGSDEAQKPRQQSMPMVKVAFITDSSTTAARDIVEVAAERLSRDRSTWSKAILRTFLRHSLTRDNQPGAPWQVKRALSDKWSLALDYDKVPDTVKEAEAKREETQIKRAEEKAKRAEARKRGRESESGLAGSLNGDDASKRQKVKKEDEEMEMTRRRIRYPIQDLEVPLETFQPLLEQRPVPTKDFNIPMTSVETFLLNWIFLQTFGKPLGISPFTLDDFENALRHSQTEPRCEMICEIYATLLLVIALDRRAKGGTGAAASTSATLSLLPGVAHSSGSAAMSREGSNLGGAARVYDGNVSPSVLTDQLENPLGRPHIRDELVELRSRALEIAPDWGTMTPAYKKSRQGWERMLLGCVAELASPSAVPNVEMILKRMIGEGSDQDDDLDIDDHALSERYIMLDLADKISLVAFLSDLAVGTKVIRDYMDECESSLTEMRKEKIEISKQKKRILDERWQLEHPGEERAETSGTKKKGTHKGKPSSKALLAQENGDAAEEGDTEEDSSDEDGHSDGGGGGFDDDDSDTGSIRQAQKQARTASRQAILKERAELRATEDANRHTQHAKARDIARAKSEGQKQLQTARRKFDEEEYKLLRREDQIERDMRKLACFRGKPLGRDRFMNRYWWLDGVGVGLLGLGGQVTYGTGRIFLQSASEADLMTLESLISRSELKKRREKEEGPSALQAGEWAYYGETEQVDDLLAWCNAKGVREFQLKNAIVKNYNYITGGMKRRQMDLVSTNKSLDARRSQRAKVANAELVREGHMAWTNKRAKD